MQPIQTIIPDTVKYYYDANKCIYTLLFTADQSGPFTIHTENGPKQTSIQCTYTKLKVLFNKITNEQAFIQSVSIEADHNLKFGALIEYNDLPQCVKDYLYYNVCLYPLNTELSRLHVKLCNNLAYHSNTRGLVKANEDVLVYRNGIYSTIKAYYLNDMESIYDAFHRTMAYRDEN